MRRLVISLLGLALGCAAAQAPATPRTVNPDLIFALLGSANTIAIDVPEGVQHLYLAAMLDGEVVLEDDRALTTRRGGELTATITAGALGPANDCPLQLFFRTGLENADGREFASGTTVRCHLPSDDVPAQPARVSSPLGFLPFARDLPLNTWLAMEAARPQLAGSAFDPESLAGMVVFYLYLSTEDATAPPMPPTFTTMKEIREAFWRPAVE